MQQSGHWAGRLMMENLPKTSSEEQMLAVVVVVDVTTLKMARKPVKLQKENPAGCAGEGKQSKGN